MYKFETETNEAGEVQKLMNHEPNGYNPTTGIYASSFIFQGDWEDELSSLNYTKRVGEHAEISKTDAEKGISTQYLYNAFRSPDGLESTTEMQGEFWDEEDPASCQYTPSYYSSPKLRSILDWFKCDKTRIRIFQQQPGAHMPMHTDMDNQRGTKQFGETLRIFVQLTEQPGGAWYRFKTVDSEVSINLQKGQFLIFNPDHTGHQTQNLTDIPRNAFMLIVKRNQWIDDLTKNETMVYVDVNELAKQKKIA
jgi:hypothetical protein